MLYVFLVFIVAPRTTSWLQQARGSVALNLKSRGAYSGQDTISEFLSVVIVRRKFARHQFFLNTIFGDLGRDGTQKSCQLSLVLWFCEDGLMPDVCRSSNARLRFWFYPELRSEIMRTVYEISILLFEVWTAAILNDVLSSIKKAFGSSFGIAFFFKQWYLLLFLPELQVYEFLGESMPLQTISRKALAF